MKKQTLIAGFVALSLSAFALPSQAADISSNISSYVFGTLGDAVAAQGNNALRQMRDEIKKSLAETLKPLLPSQAPAAEAADMSELVQMHEQARDIQ